MSRASGSDRASRSSLVTTRVVACAAGGERLPQAGSSSVGSGQAVDDEDPRGVDAERLQAFALDGQVLSTVETLAYPIERADIALVSSTVVGYRTAFPAGVALAGRKTGLAEAMSLELWRGPIGYDHDDKSAQCFGTGSRPGRRAEVLHRGVGVRATNRRRGLASCSDDRGRAAGLGFAHQAERSCRRLVRASHLPGAKTA